MIRVERSPEFWTRVASHPACAGAIMGLPPEVVGALAANPTILPLAAQHGGFLFQKIDALGFVAELHTLFTPEGWGREALISGIEALNAVWLCNYQVLNTFEMRSNPRSQPPRSFGFVQAGDWRETPVGEIRLWTLTRAAWAASPAARRRRKAINEEDQGHARSDHRRHRGGGRRRGRGADQQPCRQ